MYPDYEVSWNRSTLWNINSLVYSIAGYSGGPVTHLYESLTGNNWNLHGVSKYCCYSIYQQGEGDDKWKPLVVNQVLSEEAEPTKEDADPQKEFTWA